MRRPNVTFWHAACVRPCVHRRGALPRCPAAYLERGNLRQAQKEYDLAVSDYDAAIKLQPNLLQVCGELLACWCTQKTWGNRELRQVLEGRTYL